MNEDPLYQPYPPEYYFERGKMQPPKPGGLTTWWILCGFLAACAFAGYVGVKVQREIAAHSIDSGSLVGPVQERR